MDAVKAQDFSKYEMSLQINHKCFSFTYKMPPKVCMHCVENFISNGNTIIKSTKIFTNE